MSRHCGVLGDPISHSLSPALHRAGYASLGLDWTYDAHRVSAETLQDFLAGLDPTWRGLSLTMPLKRLALPLCTSISHVARQAGGVNTLILDEGTVHGDNTDVPGAEVALRDAGIASVRQATILGGGATATSTGLALLALGATRIVVAVRSPERAAETAATLAAHPSGALIEVAPLSDPFVGEVLVSTIPGEAQDAVVERAGSAEVVFDVIYHPWPTPLAAAAAQRGQVLVGGLDLLVAQAALQFTAFTGMPAPVAAMRAAGEDATR